MSDNHKRLIEREPSWFAFFIARLSAIKRRIARICFMTPVCCCWNVHITFYVLLSFEYLEKNIVFVLQYQKGKHFYQIRDEICSVYTHIANIREALDGIPWKMKTGLGFHICLYVFSERTWISLCDWFARGIFHFYENLFVMFLVNKGNPLKLFTEKHIIP